MKKFKTMTREQLLPYILFAVLIVLFAVFTIINPVFLSWDSFHSILLTAVPVGIMAIGECVAITAGYFDMSVVL